MKFTPRIFIVEQRLRECFGRKNVLMLPKSRLLETEMRMLDSLSRFTSGIKLMPPRAEPSAKNEDKKHEVE